MARACLLVLLALVAVEARPFVVSSDSLLASLRDMPPSSEAFHNRVMAYISTITGSSPPAEWTDSLPSETTTVVYTSSSTTTSA